MQLCASGRGVQDTGSEEGEEAKQDGGTCPKFGLG